MLVYGRRSQRFESAGLERQLRDRRPLRRLGAERVRGAARVALSLSQRRRVGRTDRRAFGACRRLLRHPRSADDRRVLHDALERRDDRADAGRTVADRLDSRHPQPRPVAARSGGPSRGVALRHRSRRRRHRGRLPDAFRGYLRRSVLGVEWEEARPGSKVEARVLAVADGAAQRRFDHVATEEPLEIRLVLRGQTRTVAVTMRTPGADFELAAGFLYGESVLKSRDDVRGVSYCVDRSVEAEQRYNIVNVELSRELL